MEKEILSSHQLSTVYKINENGPVHLYKVMNSEHPSGRDIALFYNEFLILQSLQISGVRNVIRRESMDGRQAYVLEYVEGHPLSDFSLGSGLDLKQFLVLGTRMAEILQDIHREHIIHRDIKPSNFIYNPTDGKIHLIDFGLASRIDIKSSSETSPDRLAGSLPYISPEQTGRMNRMVDYRSDIYSLGATFYYMLTGNPPFRSTDPMEIVHSHIARVPRSPSQANPIVPEQLSRIVLKMLSKNAEDRYQSGSGLKSDLERCLQMYRESGSLSEFEPGERDVALNLKIPEKLFGREAEIAQLMERFHRSANGGRELLLISGYPGIGKSAAIMELYRPITLENGYFLQGKFDRFQKENPFHGLVQALQGFCEMILSQDSSTLSHWKKTILDAVGEKGAILTEIIPALRALLGEQPPLPELEGQEAYNRMIYTFGRFIGSISSEKNTMVIFLDDLQWADPASLDLVRSVMTDNSIGHLFLIGAYRDNEVDETHPLTATLKTIESRYGSVTRLHLEPLQEEHVLLLLSETFNQQPDSLGTLASMIYERTGGNPFFIKEFLHSIYDRGHLYFDDSSFRWTWNQEAIGSTEVTTNVVDLLEGRIRELNPESRKLLEFASCMGNTFSLRMLAGILKQPVHELASRLQGAIDAGIIIPLSDDFRFATIETEQSPDPQDNFDLHFVHDRLQEAAYGLLDETSRNMTHLSIARLLLESRDQIEEEEALYIANQFNPGLSLIEDEKEKMQVAAINDQAGKKAKRAAAYDSAHHYFTCGLSLLSGDSWTRDYEFTLALHNQTAETAFLSGRFQESQELCLQIIRQAKKPVDTLIARYSLLQIYNALNDLNGAISQGIEGLRILGVKLPQKAGPQHIVSSMIRARLALRKHRIEDLILLPEMTDPSIAFAMRYMQKMTPSAFRSGSNLFPVLIFTLTYLTTKYGTAPLSVFAFGSYAIALCGVMGDYEKGYGFGKMIMNMPDHIKDGKSVYSHSAFLWNNFIRHWKEPIALTVDEFMVAYRNGFENGYLFEVLWTAHHRSLWSFFVGRELGVIYKQLDEIADLVYVDRAADEMVRALKQMILNLQEGGETPWKLVGDLYNEDENIEYAPTEAAFLQLKKVFLRFLFHKHESALEETIKGEKLLSGMTSMPGFSTFLFLAGLVRMDAYRHISPRKVHLKTIRKTIQKFQKWATILPGTHQHRLELLRAELHYSQGHIEKARDHFDRAVDSVRKEPARANVLEEAIVMERAAEFYSKNSGKTFAGSLIQFAYSAYDRWGAHAKTSLIRNRYIDYSWAYTGTDKDVTVSSTGSSSSTDSTITRSSTGTGSSSTRFHIHDYLTIVKSAQVIAGEMVLDNLLKQLMKYILENAGADHGILIVNDLESGRMQIRAEGMVEEEEKIQQLNVPVEEFANLPHSLIQLVSRTKKEVIIDDLNDDRRFGNDEYFQQNSVRSVLCGSILYQGREVGIIYLENRLHGGVFDATRIEILNIITGQAAVSIHNALLYESIQKAYQNERKLKDAYRSFVPEEFLKVLKKESILDIRPGDCVETNMSVLFADIRSFTTLSESMTPEENFTFLNEFLSHMNPAIVNNGGFIDKYIGDSIMALFPGDAGNALTAGLDMLRRLDNYNQERLRKGLQEVRIGVGINTGKLMLGTIGTADRMDGTVISDAVNIASRVETATKAFQTPLLLTENTVSSIEHPERFRLRPLNRVQLKGKTTAILIYTAER